MAARVLRYRDWVGNKIRVERAAKDRLIGRTALIRGPKNELDGEKIVPVSPDLRDSLDAWIDPERRVAGPDSALFTDPGAYNTGKWWSETEIRRTWAAACAVGPLSRRGSRAAGPAGSDLRRISAGLRHGRMSRDRIQPDKVLHVCSGMLEVGQGIRVDIRREAKADVLADGRNLPFADYSFPGALIDPP